MAAARREAKGETIVREPLIVFEDVWKTYPLPRPPTAPELFFARLGGLELEALPLEDDDEDDEVDEAAEAESADAGVTTLRGVSLALTEGTCVVVEGAARERTALLQLAAGLAAPTRGRVIVHGTVAPALETLLRLTGSRLTLEKTLLALAAALRLPRRDLRARMGAIFEAADCEALRRAPAGLVPPERRRRLLLAAMLALEADVLLLDLPLGVRGSDERAVVVGRLEERKRAGALVVVGADDAAKHADLADQVVHLREGEVVSISDGPAPAPTAPSVEEEPEAAAATAPVPPKRRVGFNEHVALLSGSVVSDDGVPLSAVEVGRPVTFVVELEVATPVTEIQCGVSADPGGSRVSLAQPSSFVADEPGIYRAAARLPEGFEEPGSYTGQIGAIVGQEGRTSRLLRFRAFECRVVDGPRGDRSSAGSSGAVDGPTWTVEIDGRRVYPVDESESS